MDMVKMKKSYVVLFISMIGVIITIFLSSLEASKYVVAAVGLTSMVLLLIAFHLDSFEFGDVNESVVEDRETDK